MAQTFSQSQLTPPLASLQFLRPYTKDQVSGLTPDASGKLFSLGDSASNIQAACSGLRTQRRSTIRRSRSIRRDVYAGIHRRGPQGKHGVPVGRRRRWSIGLLVTSQAGGGL